MPSGSAVITFCQSEWIQSSVLGGHSDVPSTSSYRIGSVRREGTEAAYPLLQTIRPGRGHRSTPRIAEALRRTMQAVEWSLLRRPGMELLLVYCELPADTLADCRRAHGAASEPRSEGRRVGTPSTASRRPPQTSSTVIWARGVLQGQSTRARPITLP